MILKKDLLRKYQNELHANEIVLLAYYIATINIENAFHDAAQVENYLPFKNICFTDTFQTYENQQEEIEEKRQGAVGADFKKPLQENFALIKKQLDTKIEIIVGNPPYSVGQKSANDNAQNNWYKNLEERISGTYAAKTDAVRKAALYDSYIKAFRWASDRIKDGGIIGFVTNAGWLDGAAMDGLRNCFAKEFSSIYVFNLRGNQRTQGEISRKEGGKIFGSGSRAPIAITILVKNPAAQNTAAEIFYCDIGDYLSREDKLAKITKLHSVLNNDFKILTPNDKGDWINQRGDEFENFLPLAPERKFDGAAKSFFVVNSMGVGTSRDAWVYNFSKSELAKNMFATIQFYNQQCEEFKTAEKLNMDAKKISWSSSLENFARRDKKFSYEPKKIFESIYRPFCKQYFYFGEGFTHRRSKMDSLFPNGTEENFLICVTPADEGKFSVLISDEITDLHFNGDTQCFPLYWYKKPEGSQLPGFETYERQDGITEFIWRQARFLYGDAVTKEDIFYYVYGFLHLPTYKEKFSADLKKSLPRIFLVPETKKFWQLSKAGRALAEIHLNYEKQPPANVDVIKTAENYRVEKMKLSADKKTLIYNADISIKNIPARAFEYVVNGRSPLEWIIDRYQVKKDSASGIENNPNDWAAAHGETYILDLILSCITVSLKTLDIVENLPSIDFE